MYHDYDPYIVNTSLEKNINEQIEQNQEQPSYLEEESR
jgi:hypothetical protein